MTAGPQRADARKNVERILDAAVRCLSANPDASASAIARAAGVGRVTLYAHFGSREELVDAALVRVLQHGDVVLSQIDLEGHPEDALRRLLTESWEQVARSGAIIAAASATLPPERVQSLHVEHERRVEALIERGRDEGVFRDDLPMPWLTGVLHHVLHGAATDVASGRIAEEDVAAFIVATVIPAFRPPDLGASR